MDNIDVKNKYFYDRAILAHGGKYNYSKVKYLGSKKKVIIICNDHGDFLQSPESHWSGNGCKKCYFDSKRKTLDGFIREAIAIHGNKYNYSKVVYKNKSSKICIICPSHGEFFQEANGHLKGYGCKKCYFESEIKPKDKFIKDAILVHGKKYVYSKTKYINNYTKITIVCKKHGNFLQTPKNHLSGVGCKKCFVESNIKSQEQFVIDAKRAHGNKYEYSKSVYAGSNKKVCITCKKHGNFFQTPKAHIRGSGCYRCNKITLNDGTICDSIVEAYMYIVHKNSGIQFLHNKRYGKELGRMRYDFYFPSLDLYEEVTSYPTIKKIVYKYINEDFIKKYYDNIKRKQKYVENNGHVFKLTYIRLTAKQRKIVFDNLKMDGDN